MDNNHLNSDIEIHVDEEESHKDVILSRYSISDAVKRNVASF